jgi:hypothetical protein
MGRARCSQVAACLVLVAACGDDDGAAGLDASGDPADATPGPDADPSPRFDEVIGTIALLEIVDLTGEKGPRPYTTAFGQLFTSPPTRFHTEAMRDGACRLLTFEAALCDPFCAGICLAGNECVPYPTYVSAGTITVQGLTEPLQLVAEPSFNFYNPASFPLPEDLFADDAEVLAEAPGDELPAFSIAARGVAPLAPGSFERNLVLEDGADATVTWPAGRATDRVRLTLNTPNRAHGQPFDAIIECDAPDTGSVVIPQAIVEAFPATSGAGICVSIDCPPSTLRRYARGAADVGDGEIELVVGSELMFGVLHD